MIYVTTKRCCVNIFEVILQKFKQGRICGTSDKFIKKIFARILIIKNETENTVEASCI